MLILRRKVGEKIFIGPDITVMVTQVDGGRIHIGIDAPIGVEIHREEVRKAIERLNLEGSATR